MDTPEYIQLLPDCPPPLLSGEPFRAVVIIEASVTSEWRTQISAWLVRGGCLYAMAWGQDCEAWHDSIDHANLAEFDYGDIPDDRFVMTTWHANDTLDDVFWFCAFNADHPHVELGRTILVHISPVDRGSALHSDYQRASNEE